MAIGPNELIKAVNNTERELDVVGTKFAPGQTRIVTFLWMINHFGDPRSVLDRFQVIRLPNGESMGVQPRQSEVMRVQRMWNIGPTEDAAGRPSGLRSWDQIPPIEFYDLDTGDRIRTPFDDPTGDYSEMANVTVDHQSALEARLERLERQNAQLRQLSGLDETAYPSDTTDIPQDDSLAGETQSPWAHSQERDK